MLIVSSDGFTAGCARSAVDELLKELTDDRFTD
jgi:hypothetical protein